MPHEAMVDGEQISKEDPESNGWITAHRKRNAAKTRVENETLMARPNGARVGATKAGQLRKVAAASRLPRLPKSHFRVVVRPGGGLDVRKCSQLKVTQAILMAARLPPAAAGEEDIVCANAMQNIFVISTPSELNANAYCKVQGIILADKRHPIAAYITPPGNTCRGVVRGIDADLPEAALQSLFVTPEKPDGARSQAHKRDNYRDCTVQRHESAQLCPLRPQHDTLHAVQEANRHLPHLRPSRPQARRLP
ncbi:hypothetical protein MTO96_006832 [Rhipicephalus appendiculatus]